MSTLNETHDPALRSWAASANTCHSDFPIQNLPVGVFRRKGSQEAFRGGVAIGEHILDLAAAANSGVFSGVAQQALQAGSECKLNALMRLGAPVWSALRLALSRALREGSSAEAALEACLVPRASAEFDVPAHIGDYTDFYTSIHHATNIGRQFRPDQPLLPNYKWVPIGYHGRASSIGISGQEFRRPLGQTMAPGASSPVLAPSKRLDIELELGIFIGQGNELGARVAMDQAEEHVFGLCLLNDWSARDLQAWEYQPLGPFLAKTLPLPCRRGLSPWTRWRLTVWHPSGPQPTPNPCRIWTRSITGSLVPSMCN